MKRIPILVSWILGGLAGPVAAQGFTEDSITFEVYGHVMTDVIHDFKQVDPDWFDVLRPTRLPAFDDQFAPDNQT